MFALPFMRRRGGGGGAASIPPGTYATPQDVAAAISQLIGGAPDVTLDTIAEIAARIIQDESSLAAVSAAIANKQDKNAKLTALSALALAADKLIYATGENTLATSDLTAFARSILAAKDAAGARAAIGAQKSDVALDTVAALNSAGAIGQGAVLLSIPLDGPDGTFRRVVTQPIRQRLTVFFAAMGSGLSAAVQALGQNMRELTSVRKITAQSVTGTGAATIAYLTWAAEEFNILATGDPYRLLSLTNTPSYGAGLNSYLNNSGVAVVVTCSLEGSFNATAAGGAVGITRNGVSMYGVAVSSGVMIIVPTTVQFVLQPGDVLAARITSPATSGATLTANAGLRLIVNATADRHQGQFD